MNKKNIKRILTIIEFGLIFMLLYFYMMMVFMPKDSNDMGGQKYYRANAYQNEISNSLDVMMYGNSDVYSGISPMQIYQDYDITSYNCANEKETAKSMLKHIKRTLKKQKPKVIVIDTDCLFVPNNPNVGSSKYSNVELSAPVKYHARWKELELKDFYTMPNISKHEDPFKGYKFSKKKYNYTLKENYMQDFDAKPFKLEKSVLKDVKKIKKICDKKHINLLFITIPTPITWTNAKHNTMTNLCEELQIDYIDFNLQIDNFDFDYQNYFRDNGNHLNIYGAQEVSDYLGNYLKSHYKFNTHKQKVIKAWDKNLKYYNKYLEEKL